MNYSNYKLIHKLLLHFIDYFSSSLSFLKACFIKSENVFNNSYNYVEKF